MNITIKDLAQELQLSVATISKALKDSYEISEATKQRVLARARELNYRPNPYASSLRKRSSKTIAVVVPEVADSFFALSINGIESIAQEKGFHVLIYQTHENGQREKEILHALHNGRVDGVLISVSGETAFDEELNAPGEQPLPLVFFDRVCQQAAAAKVQTDDVQAGFTAAQHLIENGCRHIAFLSMGHDLSIIRHRQEGFQQAMAQADKNLRFQVWHCPPGDAAALDCLLQLLRPQDRPDGLIGSVENLAMLAYSACHQLQLRIPADVKVIGFSNMKTAALLNPGLTTITQPAFEMGRAAASLLFKALAKPGFQLEQQRLQLPSLLQVRASTSSEW